MDSQTTVSGEIDLARVRHFIAHMRKTQDVVIERGEADGSLFIATGACLLRVPESHHFAAYVCEGVKGVSLNREAITQASSDYAASWQQYMDQFNDESTVETLVPTRLLARVPQFAGGNKPPLLCMYYQLRGKEEEGSIVWIRLEIAELFSPNPDDLTRFIWQLSATGLVRVAQVSGWCAIVRPDTPHLYPPAWYCYDPFL
jgi:hypothetical protein